MFVAARLKIRVKRRVADLIQRPRYVEYCAVCIVITITAIVAGSLAQSCVSAWYNVLTVAIQRMRTP